MSFTYNELNSPSNASDSISETYVHSSAITAREKAFTTCWSHYNHERNANNHLWTTRSTVVTVSDNNTRTDICCFASSVTLKGPVRCIAKYGE